MKPVDFNQFREVLFHSQLECQDVGFLANIIENHDEPRGASRYLPEYLQNDAGVKMLGTISILLRGIPFIYQGQEIGMRNCRFSSIDEYDDIGTRAEYEAAVKAGISKGKALEYCYHFSRDNARTPMQWANTENAGFTSGTPWLKVNPQYHTINVEEQLQRKDSVLQYYRRLIALRKSPAYKEVFTYGEFSPLYEDMEYVFAYERRTADQRVQILSNFGTEQVEFTMKPETHILLNNMDGVLIVNGQLILESGQVVVLE